MYKRSLSARDNDVGVAQFDSLVGQMHGFQTTAAKLVDGHGTCLKRQSTVECCLACGILSGVCSQDLAHDDLVDLLRLEAGTLEQILDHGGTELGCRYARQGAAKTAHGRARCGDDYDVFFVHEFLRLECFALAEARNVKDTRIPASPRTFLLRPVVPAELCCTAQECMVACFGALHKSGRGRLYKATIGNCHKPPGPQL